MSYFSAYSRQLVGGSTRIPKTKLRPGNVVSFNYNTGKKHQQHISRKIPRLVFILNAKDNRTGSRLIHGPNLEWISWLKFKKFMKIILVRDTVTLIKRRYEIRGPFDEILERPLTYYQNYIKVGMLNWDCYRTYNYGGISNLKLWALDYKTLFPPTDTERRSHLINEGDRLSAIQREVTILNDIIDLKSLRVNTRDKKYKQLVMSRFGSVQNFEDAADDVEDYVNLTDDE